MMRPKKSNKILIALFVICFLSFYYNNTGIDQVSSNSFLWPKDFSLQGFEQNEYDQSLGYLLNTSWSNDPMLGQIKTDLFLRDDLHVYVLPLKPDKDPPEGNLLDYLMLGLLEHPRIILVNNTEEADVYLSVVGWTDESKMGLYDAAGVDQDKNIDWARVVVIDEHDPSGYAHHGSYSDGRYLAFFKRSLIHKTESQPKDIHGDGQRDLPFSYWPFKHNLFPFAYGITDRYLRDLWDADTLMKWDDGKDRTIPVVSTLRYNSLTFRGARQNITNWLQEMKIEGAIVGPTDNGNRDKAGSDYWATMKNAEIIAHANPGEWEGDFRLWESLCSKALVFVDYMYLPHSFPLIDGEDVIFYDPFDADGFKEKVNYYLEHKDEARTIAMNGFYKAIHHHRYINRIDYVFNTISLLTDPAYKNSGMHLKETMMNGKHHFFKKTTKLEKEFEDITLEKEHHNRKKEAIRHRQHHSHSDSPVAKSLLNRLEAKKKAFSSWDIKEEVQSE